MCVILNRIMSGIFYIFLGGALAQIGKILKDEPIKQIRLKSNEWEIK